MIDTRKFEKIRKKIKPIVDKGIQEIDEYIMKD